MAFNLLVMEGRKSVTGRGHLNTEQIEKAMWFFRRKHPREITPIQLAKYLKCENARAARIIDILSGNETDGDIRADFLLYSNDDNKPIRYGIFIDKEYGIYAI
jgi:hypothetical protein